MIERKVGQVADTDKERPLRIIKYKEQIVGHCIHPASFYVIIREI